VSSCRLILTASTCSVDGGAAMAFLRKAMRSLTCAPQTATLDSYALSHRAVRELKADGSLPMDTMLLAEIPDG
jgi:hypothetical protein